MTFNGQGDVQGSDSRLGLQVVALAREVCAWPIRFLESRAWAWDDYQQVRYAPLHAAMALRALAGRLVVERAAAGRPMTLAQHALADHHAAFRDLEALLLGFAPLADAEIDAAPAPGEWPVRTIVAHVHETERYFLATVLNALDGGPVAEINAAQIAARTGEPVAVLSEGSLAEVWSAYARLHGKVQAWLVDLGDDDVTMPSTMWERTSYPVSFRMLRFAAHLREHTNQVAKTLRALDREPGEGEMLARQLLAALAEVEGLRLGMGDLGAAACDQLADELAARFATVSAVRADADLFEANVAAGNVDGTRALLVKNPDLAYAQMEDGVSALLYSLYRGRSGIVDALRASGMRVTLHEASALGDTARIARILGRAPEKVDAFSSDGYTPLQLAGFFGRTEAVALLLAKGADVNACQAGGRTPLMAAIRNEDAALQALPREAGAVDATA